MKRICFDIESNVKWPPRVWGTAPQRRDWLKSEWLPKNKPVMWWAVAFDRSRRKHYDFHAPSDLVRCLSDADELISFNGRRSDLLILEALCTEDVIAPLWRKRHHDLRGWKNQHSLKEAVRTIVGASIDDWEQRIESRAGRYMKQGLNRNLAIARATARLDVDWTAVLFRDYRNSKDTGNTFTGPPTD